jgi:hypothetical protein
LVSAIRNLVKSKNSDSFYLFVNNKMLLSAGKIKKKFHIIIKNNLIKKKLESQV